MYVVELTKAAERDRSKLERRIEVLVTSMLAQLAEDPRGHNVVKLVDVDPPLFRCSKGDWRIVFAIDDENQRVTVERIRNRKDAY